MFYKCSHCRNDIINKKGKHFEIWLEGERIVITKTEKILYGVLIFSIVGLGLLIIFTSITWVFAISTLFVLFSFIFVPLFIGMILALITMV